MAAKQHYDSSTTSLRGNTLNATYSFKNFYNSLYLVVGSYDEDKTSTLLLGLKSQLNPRNKKKWPTKY